MNCPTCTNVSLVMSERKGIEIDYCPKCRGVWLDRGELDKLIEKSSEQDFSSPPPPQAPAHMPPPPPHAPYAYRKDLDDSKYGYQYGNPYKKQKKWWTEIFD